MKKILVLLLSVLFSFLQQPVACTTFFINHNGEMIFGRNYDWVSETGMVCSNMRGLSKTSIKMPDGNTIHWVSKYGSMTFNQFGKEFPTGGMNEKGLVVELMWADGTQYPQQDKRPAIGVLQWIQYQLDNNATIEEVIASDKDIRISTDNPPLHYLVADATGNAATIEFYNGKAVVHKGRDLPFPVLTNSTYQESAKTAIDAKVLTGNKNFSIQDNSLQRFTKACSMVQEYQKQPTGKQPVEYAFNILSAVAQNDYTKWSIVYDMKNKKVYFKTASYQDIKSFVFNAFDFNCDTRSKMTDMNRDLKGDISKMFIPFNTDINREIIKKAVSVSRRRVEITDAETEAAVSYTGTVKCN